MIVRSRLALRLAVAAVGGGAFAVLAADRELRGRVLLVVVVLAVMAEGLLPVRTRR